LSRKNVTEELLRRGESIRLEFVESPEAIEKIAQSVCAMLNSKGGTVLVGVDDQGQVIGEISDRNVKQLHSFLHEQITPQVLFTVTLDEVGHGKIISVDVPEGRDQPYVFNGTVFVRSGSHTRTRVADAETMREMVERRSHETERWERRTAGGLEISELDSELMNETVRRAQDRRGYRFENPRSFDAVLADLSLFRFGQLTNAADVLFGRRIALRHPQTRLRAVRYETDRANNFIDEQLYEGPAFILLEEAMAFLKRHIPIRAEFRAGQLSRESRPEYPFYSLREGLVNALVHRDYASFSGGVSVSIYPGRVEIWNSGHLPKGLTPSKLRAVTHDSILVNPDISHVFYLYELMERVGRGTFKIVQECREMGMKLPEWRSAASGVRLTLYAAKGSVAAVIKPNERQDALLKILSTGERIKTPEFHKRFGAGVSERQARRDLKELEEAGLLERIGAGPTTAYERTDKPW